jgi:hypothetical protein
MLAEQKASRLHSHSFAAIWLATSTLHPLPPFPPLPLLPRSLRYHLFAPAKELACQNLIVRLLTDEEVYSQQLEDRRAPQRDLRGGKSANWSGQSSIHRANLRRKATHPAVSRHMGLHGVDNGREDTDDASSNHQLEDGGAGSSVFVKIRRPYREDVFLLIELAGARDDTQMRCQRRTSLEDEPRLGSASRYAPEKSLHVRFVPPCNFSLQVHSPSRQSSSYPAHPTT